MPEIINLTKHTFGYTNDEYFIINVSTLEIFFLNTNN